MRMRNILITTFLCSGIIAGALATTQAIASNGPVYAPNSDWAVSKIPASAPGAEPYCALARRFSNNMVLTFARNARDESSLAIDFQQTAFSNERDYRVTFMPGYDQDRAFDVRPVSGKAIVVRLGNDPTFFDAMNRSERLSMDVAGETFNFGMTDMMRGNREMEQCIANLVEPASGGFASGVAAGEENDHIKMPAVPAKHVDVEVTENVPRPPAQAIDITEGADSAAQAQGQLEALREDNARLRNALEGERRNYEERLMREGTGSSAVAELNEKVRILEGENGDLRRKVQDTLAMASQKPEPVPQEPLTCPAQAETSPDVQKELTRLQDENKQLRAAQNGASEASGAELKVLRAQNDSLQGDLAAARAKNADLEKEVVAAVASAKSAPAAAPKDDGELAALKTRVMELETDNKGLREALKTAEKGSSAADGAITLSQLRSVEAQLSSVEQDRNRLVKQIEGMRNGKGEELLNISANNWDLEQATRRYNEAEREIQRLSRVVEEQGANCNKEKKALEYMLFDPEIATQEQISKIIKLEENEKQANKVLEKQKSEFEGRIASLEKEMASKNDIVVGAQAKLDAMQRDLASKNDEVKTAQTKLDQLETRIATEDSRRNADHATELANLRAERDGIAKQAESLRAEATQLKSEIGTIQEVAKAGPSPAEYEAAQQQIAALKAEVTRVQQEASAQNQSIASGEQDILNRKIAALEDELTQTRTAIRQNPSAVEFEQLRAERDELAQQIAVMSENLAAIETASGVPAQRAVSTNKNAIVAESLPAPRGPVGVGNWSHPHEEIVTESPVSLAAQQAPASMPVAVETAFVGGNSSHTSQGSDIQTYLKRAGLEAGSVRASGQNTYSWEAGSLFGSAEESSGGSFDSFIDGYLAKTKERCNGEFAAVPGGTEGPVGGISSYEVACIGQTASAAVSVVFLDREGIHTAIAHEASLDNIDLAMDARDRLLDSLGSSQLAMK